MHQEVRRVEQGIVEQRIVKHIIIETGLGKGVEEYGNMGDVSMLQVAVDRLRKLFPDASLEVLTDSAENLSRFCPAATPLDNLGRALWFANGVLPGRYTDLAPKRFVNLLVWFKRILRSRCPNLLRSIMIRRLKRRDQPADAEAVATFVRALQNADLLLICGAGGRVARSRPAPLATFRAYLNSKLHARRSTIRGDSGRAATRAVRGGRGRSPNRDRWRSGGDRCPSRAGGGRGL